MFVTTKHVFCPDKGMLSELPQVSFLSRQTCVCHHKTCPLSRQKFGVTLIYVATKHVLCHKYRKFCLDKHIFFTQRKYACRDKTTKIFCRDKKKFRDKTFITISILLSRQKTCFIATRDKHVVCRDFLFVCCFVATKMILVAAPANDNNRTGLTSKTCTNSTCLSTTWVYSINYSVN